jgi:hypothetical protein
MTVSAVVLMLLFVYGLLRIPSTEGFNPSDDGVILAQSYRIANGEVPHRDFISIRPAGSGIMHMVHNISPLPLELSARWLTWFEYLASAILLTALLTGSWFRGMRRARYALISAGSVVVMFVLNQNHYNLFPWTTIDSLFWFSLALYAWFRLKKANMGKRMGWQVLLIFAASCSALCRQTFVIPAFLLIVRMALWELKRGEGGWRMEALRLLPSLVTGLLPGWLYAGMLTFTGAWPDFFQQMTGRTEFWQTGILRFADSFWQVPLPFFFLGAVIAGLVRVWRTEAGLDVQGVGIFILALKSLSLLVKIILVFLVFLKPGWLFAISLTFFWLLVLDLFLLYVHDGRVPDWTRPVWWILLAAWTSSISLGDNAPVFALGWLAGAAILLQVKDYYDRFYRKVKVWQIVLPVVLTALLLAVSLNVQRQVNYRDLPAKMLTRSGGDIFPGLKGIGLSEEMADYLGEIKRLYEDFGSPAGRFAVWPNNALIYALLDSPNPFPLDWMQAAEFAGSERRLEEAVSLVIREKDPVVLVENFNIKRIISGMESVGAASPDYGYLRILDSLAQPQPVRSKWFSVYRLK